MSYRVRTLLCGLSFWLLIPPVSRSADPKWIKARFGSFEAISDDGRRSATQALSQFEQISYALGSVMGLEGTAQRDLRLDPPLRIIVFRNAKDMAGQCPAGLVTGRDRLMACTTAEAQLPRELVRELTRKLLETNFSKMPAPIETALETFFSTVESNAVHVTWGAPPPVDERTREWALLHRIITQQDLTGKARIYLHNLAAGMDAPAAGRNAFGEDAAKFNADVDRYFGAGVFNSAQAPNRPINPDRDLNTTFLTSDEGDLARADLLTPASETIYQSLLQSGKHIAEANEGLAILAMRANDAAKARTYMEAARKAGTRNFVALTTYANLEADPVKAIEILKEALTIDPKYAEAHWAFGEKLTDPARRLAEWKQAVNLAPRNNEWWAKYAQLCVEQKQYAEAGRAWVAAAQAAPTVQLREQYLTARGQIEQQRLDAEDAERRRDAAAKAAELNRLKNDARQELARIEARANTNPLSAEQQAKAVEWWDDSNAPKIKGNLMRVDCAGKGIRLGIRTDDGKTVTLVVPDTQQFEIKSGDTLTCGAQKARHVVAAYKAASKADAAKGIAGEAMSLDFAP